ncbi:hypothetical protein BJ741DRAFT_649598 [Chytriomyces cf. hyalinus JEL632]|nr:hypothetical protein BJ741DRAFT_649598 [Chytriomyces cf. hyalinus JEL632]
MSTLFLGRLGTRVEAAELEDIFNKFGKVSRLDVKRGQQYNFGFVEFEDPKDAQDAQRDIDGKEATVKLSLVVLGLGLPAGIRDEKSRVAPCRCSARAHFPTAPASLLNSPRAVLAPVAETVTETSNECFKCGKEGHFARDCREGGGGGGGDRYGGGRGGYDRDRRSPPRRRYSRSPPRRRYDDDRRRDDRDRSPVARRDDRDRSPPPRREDRSPPRREERDRSPPPARREDRSPRD